MAGPDIICVGAGKESQEVLKVFICNSNIITFYICLYLFNLPIFYIIYCL